MPPEITLQKLAKAAPDLLLIPSLLTFFVVDFLTFYFKGTYTVAPSFLDAIDPKRYKMFQKLVLLV